MAKRRNYRFSEPVKMPRGMKYGSVYTRFFSRKLGRIVTAYSTLEYENLITLEMDPEVEYYCEQPFEAVLHTDGVEKKTIFDVWVLFRDGSEQFQEVKYYDVLYGSTPNERALEQNNRQKTWCLSNGFNFCVRTEKDIRKGREYMRNLKYLYAKAVRFKDYRPDIGKIFLGYGAITIGELMENGTISRERGMDLIAELYFRGELKIPSIAGKIIDRKTEVEFCGD